MVHNDKEFEMGTADSDSEAIDSSLFVEASPFVELLGTKGRVAILDTLIRRQTSKLTAGEIAEQSDINKSTFSRNKDFLLDLNLIEQYDSGYAHEYQINKDSELVRLLAEFHTELRKHANDIFDSANSDRDRAKEQVLEQLMSQDRDSESNDFDIANRRTM